MMSPFPEDWQLLWVFECEPQESEQVFKRYGSEVNGYRVVFECWPQEMEAKLAWWKGKEVLGRLELQWVRGIVAETHKKGSTALVFTFEKDCIRPLRFQVRPYPSVEWGTCWGPR
ncbi:hypothetical protein K2D_36030 [Planctomycetes bacterium K2D]|uniref:Uncharacterized protein n=1 Tax=Botrimarina mediterranea TaxID=2528022 RepID=A0A518KBY7_9BACT|nr:hypothetical protein Spa11_35280 [Botrimarina mediterranea]QDV79982.1 hypothetical protein K2D_36030 [Planctomycetes bacterium K2D]